MIRIDRKRGVYEYPKYLRNGKVRYVTGVIRNRRA